MPLGGVACYAACHAAEVAHTQTAHCLALQSHPDVLLATVLNSNSKNIQIKRGGRGGEYSQAHRFQQGFQQHRPLHPLEKKNPQN